jgi:hypothetical protein
MKNTKEMALPACKTRPRHKTWPMTYARSYTTLASMRLLCVGSITVMEHPRLQASYIALGFVFSSHDTSSAKYVAVNRIPQHGLEAEGEHIRGTLCSDIINHVHEAS